MVRVCSPCCGPGSGLCLLEGDLWRWDGFRAWAEDAPSAAALRLQQLNRLEELKQTLEQASQRAEGARGAHEALTARLARTAEADRMRAQPAVRQIRMVADAGRALSRAEADRNLAQGRLESLGLAVKRHEEEAMGARTRVLEAERALADLGDVEAERASVDDLRMTVEAARITMMSRRSGHDEVRREGESASEAQSGSHQGSQRLAAPFGHRRETHRPSWWSARTRPRQSSKRRRPRLRSWRLSGTSWGWRSPR